MSSGIAQARRLVAQSDGHPVISLYLDLDPERFATPPARDSQIRSLIDGASREVDEDDRLSHEDRVGLREDLKRVDAFLHSPEAPFQGARALAVFCSGLDGLFETIQLDRPVPGRVVIDQHPYVEPMLAALQQRRWLVALVNRRLAWLLAGAPDELAEGERTIDHVHGQHDQGGWSQARYERSVENEAEDHLRQFADVVERRWRAEHFDRLAVGGPQELVPRFVELLGADLRAHLAPHRLDVDLSSATDADVRHAVARLVEDDEQRAEQEALTRLADAVGAGGRGTRGVEDTLMALNERRVETLLMEPGFDGPGLRCPACGLLLGRSAEECPADGTALEDVEHLREAVAEAALAQDARVLEVRHHDDLQRFGGLGALLRF